MGNVILGMTISLDGFVNDRDGRVDRLYPDLAELGKTEMLREAIRTTGAVVMGRNAYAMADPDTFADTYEFQTPIFVLTHAPPEKMPKENDNLKVIFVTDGIRSAMTRAKAAAGERNVTVIGGASTFQQCLRERLCDEVQIGIMPVLFGRGLRLFEHLEDEDIRLEKVRMMESPGGRTDIWFRVVQ